MEGIHVDTTAFDRLAAAYRDGDKILRRRISKALRDVAKPVGADVIRKGAARLPHRGGLAERVASRGSVTASISSGSSTRATLSLKNRDGIKLAGIESGNVRHPVYGLRNAWATTNVEPGVFRQAFESETEIARVRNELVDAMEAAARELAGDAT